MLEIGSAIGMTVYVVAVPISGWELVKSILKCEDEKLSRRIIVASAMGFYMFILTAFLPLALCAG